MRRPLSILLTVFISACAGGSQPPLVGAPQQQVSASERALVSHPNTTSSPTYSIIDLGAGFAPARLNRKGMVVGSLNGQAAYYKFGKASLLPSLSGATGSVANDVNNHDQIVGGVSFNVSVYPGTTEDAVVFHSHRRPTVLSSPDPTNPFGAVASAINDDGEIVGRLVIPGECVGQAVIFHGGGNVTKLIVSEYGYTRSAVAVNDGGKIALDDSTIGEGPCHHIERSAATISPPMVIPLPPDSIFTGAQFEGGGTPTDINNEGSVVGSYSYCEDDGYGACGIAIFYYHQGKTTPIYNPDTSQYSPTIAANAINGRSDIVGYESLAVSGESHAILVRRGQVTDLNGFLPAGSKWVLDTAYDINNSGAIVGVGMLGGVQHGFILLPPGCSLPDVRKMT